MGPGVPEPDALGQPLSERFYPGVGSNPSTMRGSYKEKPYNCIMAKNGDLGI